MTTVGASLREWTVYLLLCSIPTCALAQSTNETAAPESSSTTTGSTRSSPTTSALSKPPAVADATCPFRTINYITHRLPQQCLRTSWSAPTPSAVVDDSSQENLDNTLEVVVPWARQDASGSEAKAEADGIRPEATGSTDAAAGLASTGTQAEAELETDSPFDSDNFLSFEEWKKKNLEHVGQSPDNIGQARAASSDQRNRRRPVNVNALDSLGEEGEIEIDFSGFGNPPEGQAIPTKPHTDAQQETTTTTEGEGHAAPSSWALSKDAGKTCKERFNYASFDCAATVLKTNPKAKSTSSILVENKDSYMLTECSAENKFIIVELCEDILVDTIVLANYEFFSSMFRHFRVSVSDRYPVKLDRWRVLGTFEARNSREIQPFLITEPQIWARYLRIELLTHYGNEFYCPMSLLRVHGTTMMEQYRREEEEARGDDDFAEPIDEVAEEPVQTAMISADDSLPGEQIQSKPERDADPIQEAPPQEDGTLNPTESGDGFDSISGDHSPPKRGGHPPIRIPEVPIHAQADSTANDPPSNDQRTGPSTHLDVARNGMGNLSNDSPNAGQDSLSSPSTPAHTPKSPTSTAEHYSGDSKPVSLQATDTKIAINTDTGAAPNAPSNKGASNNTNSVSQPPAQTRTSVQSQPNTPPTQESFFKSISKRLQYLEANSTLSLQYIEEQSRILRDAFMKVEKKQLQKTEKFLDHLNTTVMHELKSYRNLYDQLWQSTILELEGMKERQQTEIGEIGARLSMVADELVWQKRMAVVQSTLLLLCLGLVLFVRSGTLGSQSDIPIVQQLGNTYSSFFDTPSHSPEGGRRARRRRTFGHIWRSDTSAALSDRSGHVSDIVNGVSDAETDGRRSPLQVAFSPPTPAIRGGSPMARKEGSASPEQPNGVDSALTQNANGLPTPTEEASDPLAIQEQAKRLEVLETQSGPATPRGSRDSRPSWEEVDRAIDILNAEETEEEVELKRKVREALKRRRSPLQRAESYNGVTSETQSPDSGADGDESLFVSD
ncbi:uncharacterized protein N0V89_005503 [Didymosphaeria variabile]|uniref:SUN domain-containing protein n=1 Tax=Didymosphaeria variabile TaxID=1932322 RepID=A0A9W8XMC7_9PLEO|nr:uncharacterized protein N0V89_005503 [Didymosphaeria variabile]KAJ4353773.1 hypothetical protein N0V89_005503 [Didymosphaeria variabile]